MKIGLTCLAVALALVAGCASHGHAPRVQTRYAVGNYLSQSTQRVVAPVQTYRYGYAAPAATYVAAPAPVVSNVGYGGYAAGDPCGACAPQSRTIYYDGGTATVDHVHRYREIHRHRIEVTAEDIGCVDCP